MAWHSLGALYPKELIYEIQATWPKAFQPEAFQLKSFNSKAPREPMLFSKALQHEFASIDSKHYILCHKRMHCQV